VTALIEAQIPFGFKNGVVVQVSEVKSGLACECLCPVCKRPLQARKGSQRTHHFSHDPSEETKTCEGAFETSVHLMAKQILREDGFAITPELIIKASKPDIDGKVYEDEITVEKEARKEFERVELEKRLEEIRPDIIAYTNGIPLLIEVAVTNFTGSIKKKIIRDKGLYAIEIDLSSVKSSTTKEELRKLLNGNKAKRKWLSNPGAINAKNELIAKLDEKVRQANDSINKAKNATFDKIQHHKTRPKPSPFPVPSFVGVRPVQEKQYDQRWLICESCRHIFDVPLREARYTLESIPCPACNYAVSTKTYRV
jgi:uncharacterized protein YbaR (Trm112 family)